MSIASDPAGRLHEVLLVLKAGPQDKQLRRTLGVALGVQSDDRKSLLLGLAELEDLVDGAERAILGVDDVNHDALTRWLVPVRTATAMLHQFETALGQVTAQYNETHLFSLEMCADALQRRMQWTSVDTDGIAEARGLIDELLTLLEAELDLPSDARALLLRQVAALRLSLDLVQVSGAEGIREAVAGVLGSWVIVRTQHPAASKSTAMSRVFETIGHVANLLTIAAATQQLGPAVVEAVQHITAS